jgi:hypothetical protein
MKRLIPYLSAAGYSVTDLAQPGWLATDDNIQVLINKMAELHINQDFSVILDLFSNCSHRYRQFDGTQSLPYKESGKYHMPGPIECCQEDTFKKIIRSLSPVLLSCQHIKKVVIPPLPRYLFTPCCAAPAHCTNLNKDRYAEKSLNSVSKLRDVIKRECLAMGVNDFWVLDGIGSLLGTSVGESYGSNLDAVQDLRGKFANDGVHLEGAGNRSVAKNIISALDKMSNTGTSEGSVFTGKAAAFFWRGFLSPVGDPVGRAQLQHSNKAPRSWAKNKKSKPYGRPPNGGH